MKVRRVDFYADDFLVGVQGMSDAACGIYWKACSLVYSHGGPIPLSELKRWCSSRGPFNDILNSLLSAGKLTLNDGLIASKRALNELERASNRNQKWLKNASKGGRPTKENNELEKPSGETNGETAPLTSNIHHPPPTNIVEIAKAISPSNPRLRDRVFDEDFELWWRAVPRKVGKTAAKAAYAKARRKHGVTAGELLDGIRRYVDVERGKGTAEQFIAHPSAWLNAGRWQDEEGIDYGHARRDVPTGDCGITDEEILTALDERKSGLAR